MPDRRPFVVCLLVFYVVWITIVATGNYWSTVAENWSMAVAMLLGSYVAGSTPIGGGAVGFPVLVLLFDMPGSMGRNFAMFIQSIGMSFASLYILSMRHALEWRLIRPAMLGSAIATPLGAIFLAPHTPDLAIKLTFSVIWASFGLMHLSKHKQLVGAHGHADSWHQRDHSIGFTIGVTGGVIASITGVGIDMVLYATMMLLYRADLKISIPSSVVLMAFTSIVGAVTNLLLFQLAPERYPIMPDVFGNWLAAAPVVALGAPLGAFVVRLIPRGPTLAVVSALCILQFVWTVIQENIAGMLLVIAVSMVVLLNLVFHTLFRLGVQTVVEEGHQP